MPEMPERALPRIAIATGDPAGIGPEISLKAALDPKVRQLCVPLLVGDPAVISAHAHGAGLNPQLRTIDRAAEAGGGDGIEVLAVPLPDGATLTFGTHDAAYGRASLMSARAAIGAALGREVDAVVAAPQNQTSIAASGIEFDGYPSFVARETGLDRHDVYLMLCFGDKRIVHCTLHVGVVAAAALITRARIGHVVRVTDGTLKRLGVAAPKILVAGLNPHAGEGGLFGSEEIEIIAPAVEDARADGIDVSGPFGCDTIFHREGVDAIVVMLHDQGHIAAKLLARNQTAGLSIGSPILFSSVAHGSGFDIAGRGRASPAAMIEAITRLAGAAR
jgi:4-hydroxy-L-threonine phosphate dehydrogenase PdxA